MSWYRQYRPRTVAGLHLTSVRTQLLQLLKQGHLPQVLLFAGPKGTGKTSAARIIAAILNDPHNAAVVDHVFFKQAKPKKLELQEPTTSDDLNEQIFQGTSFVVQELDAASHRGIDDIRAIKERVNLPPQEGKITVYILDEVHMLTTEAFNALLKLLEEPPAHTVFILATTELHKIPATVASRATLIPFSRATDEEIATAVTQILTTEKVEFEPAAVTAIAKYADGSFRDAVKLAEVLSHAGTSLSLELVSSHLTLVGDQEIQSLLTAVINKQAAEVVKHIEQLRQRRVDQAHFLKTLGQFLHTDLMKGLGVIEGSSFTSPTIARFLLSEINQLSNSDGLSMPLLSLELKLLDLVFRSQGKSNGPSGSGTRHQEPSPASQSAPPKSKAATQSAIELDVPGLPAATLQPVTQDWHNAESPALASKLVSDNLSSVALGDAAKLLEQWDTFINLVKDKNSSLAALLKSAQPSSSEPGVAQVKVFYKFHQEQLQQPKFLAMLEECVEPVTGGRIRFEFVVGEPPVEQTDQNLSTLAEELLV